MNCAQIYFSLRDNAKGNNNLWVITLKFSRIEFICSMIIAASTAIMTTCTFSLSVLIFPNEFHLPINSYIVWLPFQKFSLSWAFNYVFQVSSFVGTASFFVAYCCVTLILMNHTCWIVEAAKLRLNNLNSYLEENKNSGDDDLLCNKIFHEPTTRNQDQPSTSGYQRPQQTHCKSIDSDDSVDMIYLALNTDASARQHLRVNNAKPQLLPAKTTDEVCKKLIKDVVIMMCELMEWKNNLNDVLSFNFLVELSIISVIFAMCLFTLSSELSNLIITSCFLTLATFSEFFCYCLMGTRISSHIDELTAEIYNVKWYLMTPKQRLDILILLPVTQKMKTFDGIFNEINTTTFQQVKLSAKSTENVFNFILFSDFEFYVFIVRTSERSLNENQSKTRTVLLNTKHFLSCSMLKC